MLLYAECVSVRRFLPDQIKVGEGYFIDTKQVITDLDGASFSMVYSDQEGKYPIGRMNLNHFKYNENLLNLL